MKNQYFGDVNDYLKYGLLRCFANAGLSIGVCWMLTPDDGRSDGRKIKYLSEAESWRSHDAVLFDALSKVLRDQRRQVRHVQRPEVLHGALFYNQHVPADRVRREKWLSRALAKLGEVDVLFFDPDNGIEVRSKPKGGKGSDKYVYWDEIQRAWVRGCSLLIFQHFPRSDHQRFAASMASQLRARVNSAEVIPLVTSNVLFLLAAQPRHQMKVDLALQNVAKSWSRRIEKLSKHP